MNVFVIAGIAVVVIGFLFLIDTAYRYYNGKNYTNQLLLAVALAFFGWIVIYAASGGDDAGGDIAAGGSGVQISQSGNGSQVLNPPEEKGFIQKILEMLFGEDEKDKVADNLGLSTASGTLSPEDAEEIKRQLGQLDPNDRPPNMNLTLDQFVSNFNAAAQNISASYTIRNYRINASAMKKDMVYAFTDQIGVVASIDPVNDRVMSASIMSRVMTEHSKRQTVIAFNILAAATNPGLSPEQRAELLAELGLNSENFPASTKAMRGNIEYTAQSDKRAGIALTATAK